MKTIPKTVEHITNGMGLPFVIIQFRRFGGIDNAAWSKNYYDNSLPETLKTSVCGVATFRVYAKGQNPQSLLRNK